MVGDGMIVLQGWIRMVVKLDGIGWVKQICGDGAISVHLQISSYQDDTIFL